MSESKKIKRQIDELTANAKTLIKSIRVSQKTPSQQQINDLDWYASQISKLAYGSGYPEFVSSEMSTLISWCDHIHEEKIREAFLIALKKSPIKNPPW